MPIFDGRKSNPKVQAQKRETALEMRNDGKNCADIGRSLGVHTRTVQKWCARSLAEGSNAVIEGSKRGVELGKNRALDEMQELAAQRLIANHLPSSNELGIRHRLWERDAVQILLKQRFHIDMSIRSVSNYLERWGINQKRPAVSPTWIQESYPEIAQRAKKEGAEIYWAGEASVPSHPQCDGSEDALRDGPTRLLLYAITNRGKIFFMFNKDEPKEKTQGWSLFLMRLVGHASNKKSPKTVFVIFDKVKLPDQKDFKNWLNYAKDRIRYIHLPAYLPPVVEVQEVQNSPTNGHIRTHRIER